MKNSLMDIVKETGREIKQSTVVQLSSDIIKNTTIFYFLPTNIRRIGESSDYSSDECIEYLKSAVGTFGLMVPFVVSLHLDPKSEWHYASYFIEGVVGSNIASYIYEKVKTARDNLNRNNKNQYW